MENKPYNIDSIRGGISPAYFIGSQSSYLGSYGIEPEKKINGRISGAINPNPYEISTTALKDNLWAVTNDQTNDIYYYNKDGDFGKIDVSGTVTEITALSGASGNGLAYYNNYYYIATNTDVHRYGPMDGTPALEEDWWTGIESKRNDFSIYSTSDLAGESISTGAASDYAIAQSIEEENDITFKYVELLLQERDDLDTVSMEVSVRVDDAGVPSSNKLVTGTLSSSNVLSGESSNEVADYTSVLFELSSEITISAGDKRWIVLEFPDYATESYKFGTLLSGGNIYENGKVMTKKDGFAWSDTGLTDNDLLLNLYSDMKGFGTLGNETYPTIGSYEIPNHSMYSHSDGAMYFTNFNYGQGEVNKILTASSMKVSGGGIEVGDFIEGQTSGTTATVLAIERDVNTSFTGSKYKEARMAVVNRDGAFTVGETVKNIEGGEVEVTEALVNGNINIGSDKSVLKLPTGYKPVSLTGVGTDIAVSAVKTNSNASIYLWDTFDTSFYRSVQLPYETTSAMLTHNGTPYIWGGNSDGYSLSYYTGGNIEPIVYVDNGDLPLQGAVAGNHSRILWGCSQEYPESKGCVRAWGSKSKALQGLHNIIATNKQVSAISNDYVFDADGMHESGSSVDSVWRSDVISFGQPFDVSLVSVQLSRELVDTDKITVTFYYDNENASDAFEVVADDYESRHLTFNPNVNGVQNMIIEIKFECDASVILPIKVYYNLYD
jgi:hypothetical protein